jgi:hypothetical protein
LRQPRPSAPTRPKPPAAKGGRLGRPLAALPGHPLASQRPLAPCPTGVGVFAHGRHRGQAPVSFMSRTCPEGVQITATSMLFSDYSYSCSSRPSGRGLSESHRPSGRKTRTGPWPAAMGRPCLRSLEKKTGIRSKAVQNLFRTSSKVQAGNWPAVTGHPCRFSVENLPKKCSNQSIMVS